MILFLFYKFIFSFNIREYEAVYATIVKMPVDYFQNAKKSNCNPFIRIILNDEEQSLKDLEDKYISYENNRLSFLFELDESYEKLWNTEINKKDHLKVLFGFKREEGHQQSSCSKDKEEFPECFTMENVFTGKRDVLIPPSAKSYEFYTLEIFKDLVYRFRCYQGEYNALKDNITLEIPKTEKGSGRHSRDKHIIFLGSILRAIDEIFKKPKCYESIAIIFSLFKIFALKYKSTDCRIPQSSYLYEYTRMFYKIICRTMGKPPIAISNKYHRNMFFRRVHVIECCFPVEIWSYIIDIEYFDVNNKLINKALPYGIHRNCILHCYSDLENNKVDYFSVRFGDVQYKTTQLK